MCNKSCWDRGRGTRREILLSGVREKGEGKRDEGRMGGRVLEGDREGRKRWEGEKIRTEKTEKSI
jgi:hypothetical protein